MRSSKNFTRYFYLTSDRTVDAGCLTRFKVLDTVRLNSKAIRLCLAAHDGGQLAIKKRGVDHAWVKEYAALRLAGSRKLTLILTRIQGRHAAIVAARQAASDSVTGN